ncbi:PREDICTED: uncharacterized protein LOC106101369 isoform X2 [Papilio polytes]|uniref:uncharacterized protein LOC106101369 isoform X2 n=1 Tax=Papilio polytes TaxID=76194 RepID=UPI000675F912|nr:PREDICTED: uncharacterized protein LOC106101369 isoform X2 [Papilio polytes]
MAMSIKRYMARGDGHHWEEDELLYSSRDSDDSPILSYRNEKYRRLSSYIREGKTEERERRSTFSVLAKFFLFSTAMILFCVLLYIPVYHRANDQVLKPAVAGWTINTNRDTKIYVQPNNVTTIHEPKDVCNKNSKEKKKLLLLIFVCSATSNFHKRVVIRETWGNYKSYLTLSKISYAVKEKYKNYNSSLEVDATDGNISTNLDRTQRDISGFGQLLPELVKAVQSNIAKATEIVDEKRFEEDDDKMLPEFDMNRVLGDQEDNYVYDDYEKNIMEIPPRGYEESPDLGRIMSLLKHIKTFPKYNPELENDSISDPDFKLVFLLGLPQSDNNTEVQEKIDAEVAKYGDVIQEGFIDSYNNLTLKSIMMLKWFNHNCNDSVRYIMKADDDTYINMPNLVSHLRSRAKKFDESAQKNSKEYMLIGGLICGARPVQDINSKWYSPRYMYPGRVYPRYLSGSGYALSADTARVLYASVLTTTYFHLEDIFITGICALRSTPRMVARDEPGFALTPLYSPCEAHARISGHRVPLTQMRALHRTLLQPALVDKCERKRLEQMNKREGRLYIIYKYLRLLVTKDSCED